MGRFSDRIKHAWNAFKFAETHPPATMPAEQLGPGSMIRPDRPRPRFVNEKTIVAAIYTRLAIDFSTVPIRHVKLNDNGQYADDMPSNFNNCLTVEPNIDQGPSMFFRDIAATIFEYGVAAILPIDTTLNPQVTGAYDITSIRVGRVMQWYPRHVTVRIYNESKGIQEDITVPKDTVAIVENPLYAVMNEPSSTLQRLLRKLALLDAVDEQSASGNLDIIIQLPYVVKTETKREEANKRLREIELQLKGSQYGIAYVDGTEKVTQLNRPAENNLMNQIQYLTTLLYGQLGLTDEIMNGTAAEATMLNYLGRTIEPLLQTLCEEFVRKFLTKTARTQGQSVIYLRNYFKLVPMSVIAEIADKFTRNEILSSNDVRGIIGFKPSADPVADKLLNKNLRPLPGAANAHPVTPQAAPPAGQLTP